jgi:hypothetical protein
MEPEFNSYVFEPRDGAEILEQRMNLIGWTALLFAILFIVLDYDWVGLSLIGLLFSTCFAFAITRWNKVIPLNGSFPNRLTITKDMIKIGDTSYPMNTIKIIKLTCDDYKLKLTTEFVFFMRYVCKSNGTWNHLWFKYEGKEYRLRFGIDSEQHSLQLAKLKVELGLR